MLKAIAEIGESLFIVKKIEFHYKNYLWQFGNKLIVKKIKTPTNDKILFAING
jgi:hypothetical protein